MRQKAILAALVLCVATLLVVPNAVSQNARVGGVAATELLIPVGGRDLALNGSSLATTSGIEALYWNPAGLGKMSGSAEAMFSTMSYIADINVAYGAVGGKFGDFGNLGFSVKSLSFGDIPITSETDPEGVSGRLFSPSYIVGALTYSRSLTDAISFGTTVKLISETIDQVSATDFAFDFGVQYRKLAGVTGLNLGVAVKNIGPQLRFGGPGLLVQAIDVNGTRPVQRYEVPAAAFELPALVEIGLAYDYSPAENFMMSFNGTFSNNNLYYDEYRGGLELSYGMESEKLFARGGFLSIPQNTDNNISGPTFGGGVTYESTGVNVTVDYGYRQVKYFGGNQVLSFRLGF